MSEKKEVFEQIKKMVFETAKELQEFNPENNNPDEWIELFGDLEIFTDDLRARLWKVEIEELEEPYGPNDIGLEPPTEGGL